MKENSWPIRTRTRLRCAPSSSHFPACSLLQGLSPDLAAPDILHKWAPTKTCQLNWWCTYRIQFIISAMLGKAYPIWQVECTHNSQRTTRRSLFSSIRLTFIYPFKLTDNVGSWYENRTRGICLHSKYGYHIFSYMVTFQIQFNFNGAFRS